MGWISEKGQKLKSDEVLKLYRIYQDRQKLDLDMHLRFANWYTVTLTALTTASLLAFGQYYRNPYASIFVALPLLSIALICQGKLATFRFYRRYTEGRVRLTKMEHLLGLDGPICLEDGMSRSETRRELWPLDRGFLPRRYYEQSLQYRGSDDFVRGRGRGYGIGAVTDRTLNLFLTLSWTIVVFALVTLCFVQKNQVWNGVLNPCVLGIAIVLGGVFELCYRIRLKTMISETPRSFTIAVDFDGTIADTLEVKKKWVEKELGQEIDREDCDGTSLRKTIGDANYSKMCGEVFTSDITADLKPIPGAREALGRLQKMCQVMVVTARTGKLLEAAHKWLGEYDETAGLEILGVSEESTSKGHLCEEEHVELLIDDDSGHLSSAESCHIKVFMFKFKARDDYAHENMEIFRSWNDVMNRIEGLLKKRDCELMAPALPQKIILWVKSVLRITRRVD